MTQTGKISNDLSIFLLEAGYRLKHDAVFSTYFRGGGGVVYPKITVNRLDIGFASENRYEFYVLSVSGGIDAIFCPSWLGSIGFYGGLEGQLLQSVARGGKKSYGQYVPIAYPEESREPSSLTSFTIDLMLGFVYQF